MNARRFVVALVLAVVASFAPGSARADEPAAGDVDLSHPVFTATQSVTAHLVSPEADGYGGVATPFVVATSEGAGVELAIDGNVVPFSHIGKREIVRATGETRYMYFGVGLVPGPNDVVLTPLGANGARFAPLRAVVYGRGPIVSVSANLVGTLVANGRTARTLRVVGIDRWGHPAMSGAALHVTVRSGDIRIGSSAADSVRLAAGVVPQSNAAPLATPEISSSAPPSGFANGTPQTPGVPSQDDIRVITDLDGATEIPIVPGLRAGEALLRIAYDDDANETDMHVQVRPYLRAPTVTGVVTGGIGAVPGDPGTQSTAEYEANARRGLIALYASGQISEKAAATVAYDTAGNLDENGSYGSFDEDPNERPYLTYGDSSQRRDDALSTNHLYARIDQGASSIGYGEFVANTGEDSPGSLGGFDELVNGAHGVYATPGVKIQAFRATAGVAYGRQIIAPSGLASLAYDLHPNIVVGSDNLTLVVIDRHAGYIVSETALTRNVDYVIDYGSGTIRFINPPLAFDPSFNPQQILVQYEYQGANGAVATGGSARAKIGAVTVGAGYANDATGSGDVALFGQNASAPIPGGTLRVERLSTSGGLGNSIPALGDAVNPATSSIGESIRVGATGGVGTTRYDLVYQDTSAGFNDPFGGIATPGLSTLRVSLTKPITAGDVAVLVDAEGNALYGARSSDTDVSLRVHRKFGKRLKTTAAISHRIVSNNGVTAPPNELSTIQPIAPLATPITTSSATVASTSEFAGAVTQAELGATYAISPAVEASLDRVSDIGGDSLASASSPSQTSAQLAAALGKGGRAYLRELWTGSSTESFATSTQALTTAGGATHVTQIGIDRQIGPATTIDTQYGIQNAGNGSDVYSAIGVKERIFATKRLKGDVTAQHATAVGSGTGGFNQYGISLAYDGGNDFKATTAYQLRTGATPGSTLQLGAIGYVGSGVSLVASANDVNTVGIDTEDQRLGLAFRPTNDDASSILLGYQHLVGVGDVEGERTNVASLDALHRFTRSTTVTGRVAYQLDGDQYYAARTALAGVRVVQGIAPRLDIAGEVRASGVAGVPGSSEAGYAAEAGYRIGDQFRLAVGYNFQQTPDTSLAAPPRRRGFYVTVTSVVTSLLGFGKH